jgi:hypothetical protein
MSLINNMKAGISRIKSKIPGLKGKKASRKQMLTFGQGPLRNATLGKIQNIRGTIEGLNPLKKSKKSSRKRMGDAQAGLLGALESERPARDTIRVLQLET